MSPRARAVPEASLDSLQARAEQLARRWASELVLARSLERIDQLAGARLAAEAPALCAQVLRAVQSDAELGRLTGVGGSSAREDSALARDLAAICGGGDPPALAEAVEALRGVLWEALLWELSEPPARLLADLGDRLAHVCAALLHTALGAEPPAAMDEGRGVAPTSASAGAAVGVSAPASVPAPAGVPAPGGVPVPAGDPAPASSPAPAGAGAPARGRATIVDEHEDATPTEEGRPRGEQRVADGAPTRPVHEPRPEIEIRDQRRDEGPVAWIGSIGAQLERFERDGQPFAVLLIELADMERLRQQDRLGELLRQARRMEHALTRALDDAGALTRERAGRCWLLAHATDRAGAEALARRLLEGVAADGADADGPAPAVVISVAVCPEDGCLAAALAAHADVGLYAARAAARGSRSAGERSA